LCVTCPPKPAGEGGLIKKMNKTFNIILSGVGGQGVVTLLSIIDEAAFIDGYDVKSSELHGLSQRGGSIEAYIRFGNKVYSPLIQADLIIGLEMSEGLRSSAKAGRETKILINDYFFPFNDSLKLEEVKDSLNKISSNLSIIPASKTCKDKLQNEVVSTLYLLGYAAYKNLIPLKEEFVLKAIKNVVPEKYQELNIKAFQLAKE
jgi:indolepyruvate ferredoxin oxidoreductase beta subunit